MRIWIDLGNSPHVNFFAAMIDDLQKRGHSLVITSRPFANTIDLLRLKGIGYHVVGRHYGANKIKKAFGFARRDLQLYRFMRKHPVDVAISHSSFCQAVVARLLGVRCIYLNDNEHAAGNMISFLCASTIMVPEFLSLEKVRHQWGNLRKVVRYPGVKEGVYLWRLGAVGPQRRESPRSSEVEIFIRTEPWAAQYYHGARNFMDELIVNLKDKFRTVLLPRGGQQAEYYRQEKFRGVDIPQQALSLEEIRDRCTLFIGAGGTMTREAAVLGIPTISVYQDELLDVDRYLISQERMIHKPDLTAGFVETFLPGVQRLPPSPSLLEKGHAAYQLILRTLLNHESV